MKCWGFTFADQFGNHFTRLPVDIGGLTSGITAITTGDDYVCGLTPSGGVKCAGANYGEQLGDGTTTNRFTAGDVSGLTSGVTAIAASSGHTCAVTTAAALKCWGSNGTGELGDGTTATRLAPVDVIGLGSGVRSIGAGGSNTCALVIGGGLKCWGRNTLGQIGDDTNTDRHAPVDVICPPAPPPTPTPTATATATARGPSGCTPRLRRIVSTRMWSDARRRLVPYPGHFAQSSATARIFPLVIR